MREVTTVGVDLAKSVFTVHGVDSTGHTARCPSGIAERTADVRSNVALGDGGSRAARLSPRDHRRGRQERPYRMGAAGEESGVCASHVADHGAAHLSIWTLDCECDERTLNRSDRRADTPIASQAVYWPTNELGPHARLVMLARAPTARSSEAD